VESRPHVGDDGAVPDGSAHGIPRAAVEADRLVAAIAMRDPEARERRHAGIEVLGLGRSGTPRATVSPALPLLIDDEVYVAPRISATPR
jgi:hypothetical protein